MKKGDRVNTPNGLGTVKYVLCNTPPYRSPNEGVCVSLDDISLNTCEFDLEKGTIYPIKEIKLISESEIKLGIVYFIQMGNSGPIKIGYTSKNVISRLNSLQTGNPERLKSIGQIPGDELLEFQLHRKFNKSRIRQDGEWFRPDKELCAYIIEICKFEEVIELTEEDFID